MILFASCDPLYFERHAPAFLVSAALAKHNAVVNVVGEETSKIRETVSKINEKFGSAHVVNFSDPPPKHFNDAERKTFYACSRFTLLPSLLPLFSPALVLDIDCMIMKHIPEPDYDIGMFLREPLPGTIGWEAEGTRVAAGALFIGLKDINAAKLIRGAIESRAKIDGWNWFLDQIALNTVYQSYIKDNASIKFHTYDQSFMDWEFVEGSSCWTGKGSRKYDNPKYLAKKKEFEDLL